MRTTVEFEPDTAAAIQQFRRDEGLGLSEAVNALVRRGLLARDDRTPFRQRTSALGLSIDVSNVGEALAVSRAPALADHDVLVDRLRVKGPN